MKHYLLQATHKWISHKLLASGSNLVEHTEFATFLHYCVNSVGKKIFGQYWKSAASTAGDMCKSGFLGKRLFLVFIGHRN